MVFCASTHASPIIKAPTGPRHLHDRGYTRIDPYACTGRQGTCISDHSTDGPLKTRRHSPASRATRARTRHRHSARVPRGRSSSECGTGSLQSSCLRWLVYICCYRAELAAWHASNAPHARPPDVPATNMGPDADAICTTRPPFFSTAERMACRHGNRRHAAITRQDDRSRCRVCRHPPAAL